MVLFLSMLFASFRTPYVRNFLTKLSLFAAVPTAFCATVAVPAGGDLQAAINNANPGDTIVLTAGATYTGNYTLPAKGISRLYITIQTSALDKLPTGRVSPQDLPNMASLVSQSGGPIITADDYANHYRLAGLELRPQDGVYGTDLLRLGNGYTPTVAALPHDLIVDRLYIHGDPAAGTKRGIALNCGTATIQNSYISDIKSTFQDANGINSWSGTGPFTIANNYIEASAENILFGGAVPSAPGIVPSDILVTGNYLVKPMSWWPNSPQYAGTQWVVKNLFELKSARRITVAGNVMENCWPSGQGGYGVTITVRTEDGADPTAVVQDAIFENNLVRNVASGVDMQGVDDNGMGSTSNVLFHNNVFLVNGAAWGLASARTFQLLNGVVGLTIDHNTAISDGTLILADEAPSPGLTFTNNISFNGPYGIFGSGAGTGLKPLGLYFPGAAVTNNVVIGGSPKNYPPGNLLPASIADVGFTDAANGNYALAADSPYIAAANDGTPPGADVNSLNDIFDAAIQGTAGTSFTRPPVAPCIVGRSSCRVPQDK